MQVVRQAIKKTASRLGYEINRIDWSYNPTDAVWKQRFREGSSAIIKRHWQQTEETVEQLKKKYEKPVFGNVDMIDLLKLLGRCVDPSDTLLCGVSQLTHALQVAEAMERDGVRDPDFLVAALVHDLGKVLLMIDEAPEHIVGMNRPIGEYEEGAGLERCYFQWNHDEFVYSRLHHYLPHHLSWLIRYHSILFEESQRYMDERDKKYYEKYLISFRRYDQGSKSIYRIPEKQIEDYADLIKRYFPKSVLF